MKSTKNKIMKKLSQKEPKLISIPCYVVIEDDRGMGATVKAVFLDKEQSEAMAITSSHLYVEESLFYSHNKIG